MFWQREMSVFCKTSDFSGSFWIANMFIDLCTSILLITSYTRYRICTTQSFLPRRRTNVRKVLYLSAFLYGIKVHYIIGGRVTSSQCQNPKYYIYMDDLKIYLNTNWVFLEKFTSIFCFWVTEFLVCRSRTYCVYFEVMKKPHHFF